MRYKFERLPDKNILEVIKDLDTRPLERLKLGHCSDRRERVLLLESDGGCGHPVVTRTVLPGLTCCIEFLSLA